MLRRTSLRHRFSLLAIVAALCGAPAAVLGQPSQPSDTALQARLADIAHAHRGKVALYATRLDSGVSVSLDADAVVQTASDIKLTVLYEAMQQVRAGKAHWDDKVTLEPATG